MNLSLMLIMCLFMKNKIILIFTIINFLLVVSVFILIILVNNKNNISGVEIFNDNLLTTVEMKASSENRESFGTGFFIDDNGTIITNAHIVVYTSSSVVQEYDKYEIRFSSENDYIKVKLLRYDFNLDLAMLVFDADSNFKCVNLKDTNILNGEVVYTIGNMQNYGLSIAKGIVSKKELKININNFEKSVIQLNISVSEGNSGGPVFSKNGECIGIVSFRLKDGLNQLNYGYCYAISSNIIKEFAKNVTL